MTGHVENHVFRARGLLLGLCCHRVYPDGCSCRMFPIILDAHPYDRQIPCAQFLNKLAAQFLAK